MSRGAGARARSRALALAPFAILAAVVGFVHGRDIGFGFTSLDDLTLIVDDQAFLTSHDAFWRAFGRTYFHIVDASHAYYRPIVTASYAMDAHWFGAAPGVYHATNVLLHLLATWLVYALLLRANLKREIAILASIVFAAHPALVQTVAWLPGRNDSLLTVFTLAAVLSYRRPNWHWSCHAIHIASFAIAMFTKETAIVVPLVCLAWSRLVERPSPPRTRSDIATWTGWLFVIGVFAYARHRALVVGGAIDWSAPLRHVSVLVSSAGKMIFPMSLTPIATMEDTSVWPGALALAVIVVIVVRARKQGTCAMPVIAFGGVLYALALLPSLFVSGSLVLENRLYLPAVGMIVVLAELADKAKVERRLVIAFGSVIAVVLGALTLGYASAYRDPLSLGKAAVSGSPHSALAHFTLGQARQLRGDLDGAIREYSQTLDLDPNEPIVHNNLAVIYMRRRDYARAETELEAELRINPGYATAIENLSIVRRHLRE